VVERTDSLADYIKATLRLRDRWHQEDEEERRREKDPGADAPSDFWFRGHAEAGWALKPRLYRKRDGTDKNEFRLSDEHEIRSDFKRRGRQLISESQLPANDKEWYFLMQHYGAPTRLLDWTDGALLALYFALHSLKHPTAAAVWMLDPDWLNEITLQKIFQESNYLSGVLLPEWKETNAWFPEPFEEALQVMEPVALDPPHVARRVAVQHSHFTIHGRRQSGLERLAGRDGSRLVKIIIPRRSIESIVKDLASCGISETTVYPDLEGLSRELTLKWRQA